jgi:hypothetical protein
MISDFAGINSALEQGNLPARYEDLFNDLVDVPAARFRAQESYLLDYKGDVPTKFTYSFGASIIRLALGFHNAFGGLIVFGVEDRSLIIKGTSSTFDVESFNRMLSDSTGIAMEVKLGRYDVPLASGTCEIDVVLISKRGLQKPVKLMRDLDKYPAGSLFVRDRHEVVDAAARHLPTLYAAKRSIPNIQTDLDKKEVHRSLPSSPATMKEFIACDALMDKLWDWFVFGDKPRAYLHGPGGSGKSTLAFEFATSLAETGNAVEFSRGGKIDYVIYISGKETELNVQNRMQQYFSSRQFASAREQFIEILFHSGAASRLETARLDEDGLLLKISEFFNDYNGLIVLDDIDALSRRNVDTGEEALFIRLLQSSSRTKLLYTLRYPPAHALSSATRVPGLNNRSKEFSQFLTACARLFEIVPPNEAEAQAIFELTDGLPLLLESVVGLRKYCSSYSNAVESFKEKGGDEARRYLYQQEYDQLDKNGKSRQVLAALSIVREPVHFDELSPLFTFSAHQVSDALTECSSIFLSAVEDATKGTLYQIAPPAVPFVTEISRRLPYYEALVKAVQRFGDENYRPSEREQEIAQQLGRLIRQDRYKDASLLGEKVVAESGATSDPRINALTGIAYANLGGSFSEKARECFRSAYQFKYRDIAMMRSWYYLELHSEYGNEAAEKICNIVLGDEKFDGLQRSEFLSKLGQCYQNRAHNILGVKPNIALELLRKSVDAYMEALWVGERADRRSVDLTLSWLERPLTRLVLSSKNDIDQPFLLIDLLIERKHDVHVEGARVLLETLTQWQITASTDSRQRAIGLTTRSIGRIRKNFSDLERNVGFKLILEALGSFKDGLPK